MDSGTISERNGISWDYLGVVGHAWSHLERSQAGMGCLWSLLGTSREGLVGLLGHSRGLLGRFCGAIFLLIVGAGLDIDSEVHKALTRRPKPNPKL